MVSDVILDENIPLFPIDINQPKLMVFVDAAYANDQHKRRSTTGFVFTYCGGTIVYRSKAQSITTISSTEAESFLTLTIVRGTHY